MNVLIFLLCVILFIEFDMVLVICGVIGVMKGLFYGGVFSGVIIMFDEIGSEENIEFWVCKKLDNKEKIMGFGYCVYCIYDLRVEVLKEVLK